MATAGMWVVMTTLTLHLTGVALSRASLVQHRGSRRTRQWIALAAANFWWKPPHPSASSAHFGQLFLRKFQNPVGRVGANGLH